MIFLSDVMLEAPTSAERKLLSGYDVNLTSAQWRKSGYCCIRVSSEIDTNKIRSVPAFTEAATAWHCLMTNGCLFDRFVTAVLKHALPCTALFVFGAGLIDSSLGLGDICRLWACYSADPEPIRDIYRDIGPDVFVHFQRLDTNTYWLNGNCVRVRGTVKPSGTHLDHRVRSGDQATTDPVIPT